MRQLIADVSMQAIDVQQLEWTRQIFDDMEKLTLVEIYRIAETNMKLLERLARIQAQR